MNFAKTGNWSPGGFSGSCPAPRNEDFPWTGKIERQTGPASYFACAAAGTHDVNWFEIADGTGEISAKIGYHEENSVIRVSVWNQLLNEPQFVRFEVLNSAHQLIAKAFIGLYPDNDENRSKGELVLNVVVPQIDKAENSVENLAVQSYYYRVERGQLSDLTASDRDAVELSLDATDHSLSRAALQQVLDQIPSGDGA